jgi:ABC-type sugar transport system permease subunit
LNLGYGAALAMVLLAITLGVSFVMFRARRAR